jgi:hypothetical protein
MQWHTRLLCKIHKAFKITSVIFLQTAAKHFAQNRIWFPYYNYLFRDNERLVYCYLLTFDIKSRSTACKHNCILKMGDEVLPANQSGLLILNTQTGLLPKNGNMHKECDEGNCRECAVGQDTTFIPQPSHYVLATQHVHQDACTVLLQPRTMFIPFNLQISIP